MVELARPAGPHSKWRLTRDRLDAGQAGRPGIQAAWVLWFNNISTVEPITLIGSFHFLSSSPTEDSGQCSEMENINCVFVPGARIMFVAWIELFMVLCFVLVGLGERCCFVYCFCPLGRMSNWLIASFCVYCPPLALRSQKPLKIYY